MIYMNCEIIVKSEKYKPQTAIAKNLTTVSHPKQFHPHIPCAQPNQEIQIDFGGPIFDEKGNEIFFLAAIERFSMFSTASIYEKANEPNVVKFLDMSSKIMKFYNLFV